MKKTLIYGAIGGVALYLYLQLQKKKKLSAKETEKIQEGISKFRSQQATPRPQVVTPPMSITTPKGEGDGVSVRDYAPTPPAPTVEPLFIKQPQPFIPKPIKLPPRQISTLPYGDEVILPKPKQFLSVEPPRQPKSDFCKNLESKYGAGTKVQFGRGTVIISGRNTGSSLGISPSIQSANRDCISGYMEKYAK